MKLLHLVLNDKFILHHLENLAALSTVENRVIAYGVNRSAPTSPIRGLSLWTTAGNEYLDSTAMNCDLEWCDALVIHYLHPWAARVALSAPAHVTVVWSGWGGDYYSLIPESVDALLGEMTQVLVNTRDGISLWRSLQRALLHSKRSLRAMVRKQVFSDADSIEALARIDLFSAPIPEDFTLLKQAFANRFAAEYVQLNYGGVERSFKPGCKPLNGQDILLGNSATPANNHAEVVQLLAKLDLGDRKVIAPLNYGDVQYQEKVIHLAGKLLGEQFFPVVNFLPLPEYNALTSSCSIVIMNHRRQQALGNIGSRLYAGAKVFMDPRNPAYEFFITRGIKVFDIATISEQGESAFEPLTADQRAANQAVLDAIWGQEAITRNLETFLATLHRRAVQSAPVARHPSPQH